MRLLLLAMLAVVGCNGEHYASCYDNDTCNKGLTCVFLRGHGTMCVVYDDVQAADERGKWSHLLPDGGTP